MKLLIDTQLIYWWLVEPTRLPAEARRLIEDSTDSVMVSVASEWELAIKVGTKKIGLDMPTFSQGIEKAGLDRLGITPLHTHAVAQLSQFDDHQDPFDRFLVAQSRSEPLGLADNRRQTREIWGTGACGVKAELRWQARPSPDSHPSRHRLKRFRTAC